MPSVYQGLHTEVQFLNHTSGFRQWINHSNALSVPKPSHKRAISKHTFRHTLARTHINAVIVIKPHQQNTILIFIAHHTLGKTICFISLLSLCKITTFTFWFYIISNMSIICLKWFISSVYL